MEHRIIFSKNLKEKMRENGKTRRDLSEALGISYFTITAWVKGDKMPRMDKVEQLAKYFGCLKSDLIEEKKPTDNNVDELSPTKRALVARVMQMTDEELERVKKMLDILESR